MPTAREGIALTGIDQKNITLKIDNSTIVYDVTKLNGAAAVGLAVKLVGHSTVALVVDGDRVYGRLELVESDGKAAVQRKGVADLPAGNAATVTPGTPIVGALGAASAPGYVRTALVGDEPKSRGDILDSSDTTHVFVDL